MNNRDASSSQRTQEFVHPKLKKRKINFFLKFQNSSTLLTSSSISIQIKQFHGTPLVATTMQSVKVIQLEDISQKQHPLIVYLDQPGWHTVTHLPEKMNTIKRWLHILKQHSLCVDVIYHYFTLVLNVD